MSDYLLSQDLSDSRQGMPHVTPENSSVVQTNVRQWINPSSMSGHRDAPWGMFLPISKPIAVVPLIPMVKTPPKTMSSDSRSLTSHQLTPVDPWNPSVNRKCVRTYQESVCGVIRGASRTTYMNAVRVTAKVTSENGNGLAHLTPVSNPMIHASAAAAFFARAAQKLTLHNSSPYKRRKCGGREAGSEDGRAVTFMTNFSGILQSSPPPVHPALLRNIGRKETCGIGKIKVVLKVASKNSEMENASTFFNIDKRRKQVTLFDPSVCGELCSTPEDRRLGITAPKIFAFDSVFTQEDPQVEVCGSALVDILHAVVGGSDGCILSFGHSGLDKSQTMVGDSKCPNTLGVIPCAISWLFKIIGEHKQKSGSRFSVRISAVELSGPSESLRDLLAPYASDLDQSPGVYLRDDPLFGAQLQNYSELRAPTPEKAGFYLDAAVAGRERGNNNHMLYTVHLYQYSIDKTGKGGVAGGRSRLHMFDLGSGDKTGRGGLSLSAIGNVLIAIFNGQKHLPHRDHKLTLLLREALGSITCQAALLTHVSSQAVHYSEILTTVQLAARMHRMRRRKPKMVGVVSSDDSRLARTLVRSSEESSKSSSDVDPSSSEQSCDTVIYVGPADDATDGEHPPVYIPNLEEGDSFKSSLEASLGTDKKSFKYGSTSRPRPSGGSPHKPPLSSPAKTNKQVVTTKSSMCGTLSPYHGHKSPKAHHGSPSKISKTNEPPTTQMWSPQSKRGGLKPGKDSEPLYSVPNRVKPSDEEWIDGPRFSKSKVVEGRKLKEGKQEMWVDGPSACPKEGDTPQSYGYMDEHKKSMIEKWVETQTQQVKPSQEIWVDGKPPDQASEGTCTACQASKDKKEQSPGNLSGEHGLEVNSESQGKDVGVGEEAVEEEDEEEEEDQEDEEKRSRGDSSPLTPSDGFEEDPVDEEAGACCIETIEVPERDESVPMTDSGAQVTEEDIAFCLGKLEDPLPEVDQDPLAHPLRILSEENLTVASTFTDVYSCSGCQSSSMDDLPDYTQLCDDLSLVWKEEYFAKRFQTLEAIPRQPQRCQSLSIDEMLYGSCELVKPPKQLSTPSDPPHHPALCTVCQTSLINTHSCDSKDCSNGMRNRSILRHPDGASNPNLAKHPSITLVCEETSSSKEQRVPGNGADEAELNREERSIPGRADETHTDHRSPIHPNKGEKVKVSSKLSKILANPSSREGSPKRSSNKGKHDPPSMVLEPNVYVVPGHLYEKIDKSRDPKDYPKSSKDSPGAPRKSAKKHSKSKKCDEPPAIVYHPPWQKQHSFPQCQNSSYSSPNRTEPQSHPTTTLDSSQSLPEGYDSGNDSGVVARTPKGMRSGSLVTKQLKGVGVTHSPSLQCESSGYESVGLVRDSECSSLASSQGSDNGDDMEKTLTSNTSAVKVPHGRGRSGEPIESKLTPIPEGKGSPKKSRDNLNKVTLFTTCWSGKR